MYEGTPDQRTLVTFLLDSTGAAEGVRDQTINMFNAYLKALKAGGDRIEFTLIQFDSGSFEQLYASRPISKVPNLTPKTYVPHANLPPRQGRGPHAITLIAEISIPLIDAIYKAVLAVADSLHRRDDKPKVVFTIHTDGQEGSSTEHTWVELHALIDDKMARGWQFNFMGAGYHVLEQTDLMGIPTSRAQCYRRTDSGWMRELFLATGEYAVRFARGDATDTEYRVRLPPNPLGGLADHFRASVRLRPPKSGAKE